MRRRLLDAGFGPETVETEMSVLGVPPGEHQPPKRETLTVDKKTKRNRPTVCDQPWRY